MFLLIICVFISVGSFAQSIRTKFTEGIRLTDFVGSTIHAFYSGESVTIHAYKKKSGIYHFLIETDNYATFLKCKKIPFYITEKELKKLPNAQSPEANTLLKNTQQAVYQRQAEKERQAKIAKQKAEEEVKARYRERALKGQIKGTVTKGARWELADENHINSLCDAGTVTIVGYKQDYGTHYYAAYTDRVVGVYHSKFEPYAAFEIEKGIEFEKLPSCEDSEVKRILEQQSIIVDSLNAIRYAEADKKSAELVKQSIQEYKAKQPFIIQNIDWSSNSVGGIYVSLDVFNYAGQAIKYVTLQGYFLNAVGDKCRNEISGSTVWKARGVGPIGPGPTSVENYYERFLNNKATFHFDELFFYSRSANTFRLSSVTVEYTNGRKITLSGANLNKHVKY